MTRARFAWALCLLGACGARTDLDVRSDAGPIAARDGGSRDAGRRDGGPPPSCGPGSPRVLATDARFEVEVDDAHVYYSTDHAFGSEQSYRRVPKCGGEPETLLEGGLGDFSLVGEHLYFVSREGIERARTDGSGRELLYPTVTFGISPIAVGETEIFFSEPGGAPERTLAIPREGGPVREVARGGGLDVTVDATHVYLAVWAGSEPGYMGRVPIEGGEIERIGAIRELIRDLVVGGGHLYYSDSADSAEAEIFRIQLDAPDAVERLSRAPGLPLRLALADRFLYFTDHIGGAVVRVPREGGELMVLDANLPVAQDLAIDDASVYAVSFQDRTLIKVAR